MNLLPIILELYRTGTLTVGDLTVQFAPLTVLPTVRVADGRVMIAWRAEKAILVTIEKDCVELECNVSGQKLDVRKAGDFESIVSQCEAANSGQWVKTEKGAVKFHHNHLMPIDARWNGNHLRLAWEDSYLPRVTDGSLIANHIATPMLRALDVYPKTDKGHRVRMDIVGAVLNLPDKEFYVGAA